ELLPHPGQLGELRGDAQAVAQDTVDRERAISHEPLGSRPATPSVWGSAPQTGGGRRSSSGSAGRRRLRSGWPLLEQPAPLLAGLALVLGCGADRLGEAVPPLVRPAGVDDQARVEALLVGVDGRIERARPGALDDVER